MKFKIKLVSIDDADQEMDVIDVAMLDKDCERIEHLGLTMAESKTILSTLQREVTGEQVAAFVACHAQCTQCDAHLVTKGHHTVKLRTLFGNVTIRSPRLRQCSCHDAPTATFSPVAQLVGGKHNTAPELLFMEARWASLVSYGTTVKVLKDFLPVDVKLNAATVRHHTLQIAERCDATLGDEKVLFAEGCPNSWDALPPPPGPITAGIDGGYLRNWEAKKTNFEVIVGKSVPTDGAAKCFGCRSLTTTFFSRKIGSLAYSGSGRRALFGVRNGYHTSYVHLGGPDGDRITSSTQREPLSSRA